MLLHDGLLRDLRLRCWLDGEFSLSSGAKSDHYFDKHRLLARDPVLLHRLGEAMLGLLPRDATCLLAVPVGAVPLATTMFLTSGLPLGIVRLEAKDHGTACVIEGYVPSGRDVPVLVEDVVTTGRQALQALARAQQVSDARVGYLVGILDRGGKAALARCGLEGRFLFTESEVLHAT